MSRVLDPELQALIDGGHCEDHTAIIITLGDDSVVHLATAAAVAEVDGEEESFAAQLKESDGLQMSLTSESDNQQLRIQNVDKLFGQQLTSVSNALEGATAELGHIFRNPDTGAVYYDPKMPGEVMSGAVTENAVDLPFVGDIYAAQVVTDPIAAVFPYQNPPATGPNLDRDPDDTRDPNDPSRMPWKGRLPGDTGFLFLHE